MKRCMRFGAILLLSLAGAHDTVPCRVLQEADRLVETDDRGSELASLTFDELNQDAVRQNATIFVICRLGAREQARYNYRRLHNTLYRLTDYYGTYPHAKVVAAIGERTRGAGMLDVYVGSALRYRVTFRHNRDFIVDCCWLPDEPPPRQYYPHYRGARMYRFLDAPPN